MKPTISTEQFVGSVILKYVLLAPVQLGIRFFVGISDFREDKILINLLVSALFVSLAVWHTCLKSDIKHIKAGVTTVIFASIFLFFGGMLVAGVPIINRDPVFSDPSVIAFLKWWAVIAVTYYIVLKTMIVSRTGSADDERNPTTVAENNFSTNNINKKSISLLMFIFGYVVRVLILATLLQVVALIIQQGNADRVLELISGNNVPGLIIFLSNAISYFLVGLYIKKNYELPTSPGYLSLGIASIQIFFVPIATMSLVSANPILFRAIISEFSFKDLVGVLVSFIVYAIIIYLSIKPFSQKMVQKA